MKMKFDDIAIEMIKLFWDSDDLTSTYIAKSIFKPKDRKESLRKNNLIIGRLKTWLKKGIIVNGTSENRIAHYRLNIDNARLGQLLLDMGDGDIESLGKYYVIDIEGQDSVLFKC